MMISTPRARASSGRGDTAAGTDVDNVELAPGLCGEQGGALDGFHFRDDGPRVRKAECRATLCDARE